MKGTYTVEYRIYIEPTRTRTFDSAWAARNFAEDIAAYPMGHASLYAKSGRCLKHYYGMFHAGYKG